VVELQAQAGRGGVARCLRLAEHEAQALTAVGSHLQPAQGAIVGLVRPAQHRRAGRRAQALFGGPQRLFRCGVDDLQLGQVQPGGGPGRGMRAIGRGDQYDRAFALAQPGQCRPDQRQLADAGRCLQHLAQPAGRPAAAGQACVQCRVAAGQVVAGRALAGWAAPQLAPVQQPVEGDDGTHQPVLQGRRRVGLKRQERAETAGMARVSTGRYQGLRPDMLLAL